MEEQERHWEAGHVNVLVRDQDSQITSYGRHCRLLVGRIVGTDTILIREDIKHGLPESTEQDRQRVAKGWQRVHPRRARLKHVSSERYRNPPATFDSIEHRYEIVMPTPRKRPA